MSKKEINLYKICLEKIAQLLKRTYYWNSRCLNNNPFNWLPSSIIEELIVRIIHLSKSEPLRKSDLCHLIATGQVRNFKLEGIKVGHKDFMSILKILSASCENLKLIKLTKVSWLDGLIDTTKPKTRSRTKAIECVLAKATRLESVESSMEFNLKVLRNSEHLKRLKLNFTPQCHLYDFLKESHGQFLPNNSLKVFEVFEKVRHYFSYLDVACILKYCTELLEINCDISKSLEYLHAEELYNGILCRRYKLEKCCLGSVYPDVQEAVFSRVGAYIGSLTCPNLKEIQVFVKDNSAISTLFEFSHLTSLWLQRKALQAGNFTLGVQLLLQKVGTNLKTLHLVGYSDIDFSVIGMNCPNLEVLRVVCISERNPHGFSSTAFQKLISLHIENSNYGHSSASSLIGLLSNCFGLKRLTLQSAGSLTDSLLSDIMQKNSLSKLIEVRINDCRLSYIGLEHLVLNLRSLRHLQISSSLLDFDLAAFIILSIKPELIMKRFIYRY